VLFAVLACQGSCPNRRSRNGLAQLRCSLVLFGQGQWAAQGGQVCFRRRSHVGSMPSLYGVVAILRLVIETHSKRSVLLCEVLEPTSSSSSGNTLCLSTGRTFFDPIVRCTYREDHPQNSVRLSKKVSYCLPLIRQTRLVSLVAGSLGSRFSCCSVRLFILGQFCPDLPAP